MSSRSAYHRAARDFGFDDNERDVHLGICFYAFTGAPPILVRP
jgi:hypothetical protein